MTLRDNTGDGFTLSVDDYGVEADFFFVPSLFYYVREVLLSSSSLLNSSPAFFCQISHQTSRSACFQCFYSCLFKLHEVPYTLCDNTNATVP